MNWLTILALALTTPFIVLPIAFIWYLNIGGAIVALRKASSKVAASGNNAI